MGKPLKCLDQLCMVWLLSTYSQIKNKLISLRSKNVCTNKFFFCCSMFLCGNKNRFTLTISSAFNLIWISFFFYFSDDFFMQFSDEWSEPLVPWSFISGISRTQNSSWNFSYLISFRREFISSNLPSLDTILFYHARSRSRTTMLWIKIINWSLRLSTIYIKHNGGAWEKIMAVRNCIVIYKNIGKGEGLENDLTLSNNQCCKAGTDLGSR